MQACESITNIDDDALADWHTITNKGEKIRKNT